jgi:hypothetical protein
LRPLEPELELDELPDLPVPDEPVPDEPAADLPDVPVLDDPVLDDPVLDAARPCVADVALDPADAAAGRV